MGLDILIQTDNYAQLHSTDYYNEKNNHFRKHSLSRTFCNLMGRQNVINHEPELNQIGWITGVDVFPIYQMERYPDEEGLSFFLETADNEKEKQAILDKAEEEKRALEGNIDRVLSTVSNLIDKLNVVDNLPQLLLSTDFDTLENDEYFSDFKNDKGDGYINNNFGQDLRNFKRFLEFAKDTGTVTVWFSYA